MEVKHHRAGKAATSDQRKGPYKRNERVIKDDLLLEKHWHYSQQNGGTKDVFQFPRSQEQQNLFKTFQDGNFVVECSQVVLFHYLNRSC